MPILSPTKRFRRNQTDSQRLSACLRRAAVALIDADTPVGDLDFSEEQIAEAQRQSRLAKVRAAADVGDVLTWGRLLFPEKFPLPFCKELHEYFVRVRTEPFTNTEAPRGHAKTIIRCFLIPLYQSLVEPEAFRHYLAVQATELKAIAVNVSIKEELEGNADLRLLYGNQVGWRWTDRQFVLRNGIIFTAVSAGQSIRGINYRNIRPDYFLIDDLYNEDDINNPEATEKKNKWFWGTLFPARAKHRTCCIHIQGTAINQEDLLELLKKQDRWKSATFRAIKDMDTEEVLWPELNTFASLQEDRKDMGSVIFFREMQNERRDEASSIIKRSYLNAWEYDPAELYSRIRAGRDIFLAAVRVGNDPSIGKQGKQGTPTSDFNGVALVIVTKWKSGGTEFWIEGLWNERLSLDKRIGLLKSIRTGRPKGFPLSKVNIEAIGGFDDYATQVIRETNLPVHRVEWVTDKLTNLENKSHFFENGQVHLNKNIDSGLKDILLHQLTTNVPKHDDLRDAVFLCLDDDGTWNFV